MSLGRRVNLNALCQRGPDADTGLLREMLNDRTSNFVSTDYLF